MEGMRNSCPLAGPAVWRGQVSDAMVVDDLVVQGSGPLHARQAQSLQPTLSTAAIACSRMQVMNGAEIILRTLADNGVEACFSNPGTSEMQLVAAFDREPRVRPVLCLYEGVATGAADGYARIASKPAATLLHLGAGLSNGSANLHNARRACSPVVNILGDHATYHRRSEEHTSELQSPDHLVCRLLLEKKKKIKMHVHSVI